MIRLMIPLQKKSPRKVTDEVSPSHPNLYTVQNEQDMGRVVNEIILQVRNNG